MMRTGTKMFHPRTSKSVRMNAMRTIEKFVGEPLPSLDQKISGYEIKRIAETLLKLEKDVESLNDSLQTRAGLEADLKSVA